MGDMQLSEGICCSFPPPRLRTGAKAQMPRFVVCTRTSEHHRCLSVVAIPDFLGEKPGGLEEAEITPPLSLLA